MSNAKAGQTRLAVLSAVTALAGVVVGGAIGYASNRALQSQESAASARGAARVTQARLLDVAAELSSMLRHERVFDLDEDVPPAVGVDERRSMAVELSSSAWTAVVRSEASLQAVLESTQVEGAPRGGQTISAYACEFLGRHLVELGRGARALEDLAEFNITAELERSFAPRC